MSSAELKKGENMIDDAMLTDEMFELLPDSEKNSEFIAMSSKTFFQDTWNKFKKNKLALIGLIFLAIMLVGCIFIPSCSKYSYEMQDLTQKNLARHRCRIGRNKQQNMTRIAWLANDRSRSKAVVNFREKATAHVRSAGSIGRFQIAHLGLDLRAQLSHFALSYEHLQEVRSVAARFIERKQQESINQMVSIVISLSLEGCSGNNGSQSRSRSEIHTV